MKKITLLKSCFALPFIFSLGCNDAVTNSPAPAPFPTPVEQVTKFLSLKNSAILNSDNSKVIFNALDSLGNLNTSDESNISANVYSDENCSVPVLNPATISADNHQVMGGRKTQLTPGFQVTCTALSESKSSCSGAWNALGIGDFFIQAQDGEVMSPCSHLVVSNISLYNTQTVVGESVGEGNGYNLVYTSSDDSGQVSIEGVTGLTYQLTFNSSGPLNLTATIDSSIGSAIGEVSPPVEGISSLRYTVGNLSSPVTDNVIVTDQYGASFTVQINVQPSMKLSGDSLFVYDYAQLYIRTGLSTIINVDSGGTAPYSYAVLDDTIGSTFVDGVFTAGETNGDYYSERIQITDSTGNVATAAVRVSPHTYSVNNSVNGFEVLLQTSVTLIPQQDQSNFSTVLSQWTIAGTVLVDYTTSVSVTAGSGTATLTNCSISGNVLTCAMSATSNDRFHFGILLSSTVGKTLLTSNLFYSAPTNSNE